MQCGVVGSVRSQVAGSCSFWLRQTLRPGVLRSRKPRPFLRWLEQTMKGELHFEIRRAGTLHGFTAWFSVRFQSLQEDEPQLVLSTGPFHP